MILDSTARGRSLLVLVFAVSLGLLALAGHVFAQEKTPFPEYNGERVYTAGVSGSFESLNQTIKELERSSPQSYFVVLIRSAGSGDNAVARYADDLYDAWKAQAQAKGLKLDPERSVLTVVAVGDRRVAVRAGATLQGKLGLDRSTRSSLIDKAFVPFAKEQRYTDAVASLLASINNEVARHDPATTSVQTGTTLFPTLPTTAVAPSQPVRATSAPAGGATAAKSSAGGEVVTALLASLLVVGLIIGILIWLARRRTRNTVARKIKDFREQSVNVMDRLDALKARLKKLPIEDQDFKEPMSGATLALYEKTEQALAGLWDRWLEIMDILDKAQALAPKDSAAGTKELKEAEKLVSDSRAFEQIETESKACSATMDQLDQAHETARAAAETLAAGQNEVHERVERVEKENLPSVPYKPEIDGIAASADHAREILTADPIGARTELEQAQQRAVALRDRIEQVLERHDEGRTISTDLAALAEKVAGHRKEGLRLDEEGGDPDHPIAQTRLKLEALRKAVHEGDPAAALAGTQAAREFLKQARQTLDGVLSARTLCESGLPERVQRTQRLREAMRQYEAFEAELKRDFAPESWQAVAGNLAQARALLETFDRKLGEVASAASSASQKYLLGARLLGQVSQEQQAVLQLQSGVGETLSGLRALRDQCQTTVRDLDEARHSTEGYFRQYDAVVGKLARGTYDSARRSREQLVALLNEGRPDWLEVRQLLARCAKELTAARDQAEGDVRIYQQLGSELERVRREANRVGAFLAGHEEDRLAANQHFRNAEAVLSRVQGESSRGGGEWARWLEMVRGAAADLAHSERLAQEDVRLAQQAEAEIQEAALAVQKARAYFSMGVTLNTLGADAQVAEADRLYRSQDYEQAIRTAAAAIQQVREAHAAAAQQVFLRQMAMDANRREAAPSLPGGALLNAGVPAIAESAAEPAPTPQARTARGAAEAESGTAAGSWESETAERGW